jgi:hypothetical protein
MEPVEHRRNEKGYGVGAGAVVAWLALLAARPASAQEVMMQSQVAAAPAVRSSPVAKINESPILPAGRLELGGELVFLTAESDPRGELLQFTDVGLLPLFARFGVARWLEVDAGTEILIKQPETLDERLWQSAFTGLRVPFGSVFGGSVSGTYGKLMEHQGRYWQLESSLLAKPSALDWLRFELRAGHLVTAVDYRRDGARLDWLHEVIAHGEVQFGEDEGGAWIASDYAVPIAHSTAESAERPAMDPNVRLNLEIGAVISPEDTNWDLYAVYAVVDRGSVDAPGSTLPILDGGFDEQRLVLGVQHRFDLFEAKPESEGPPYEMTGMRAPPVRY